MPCLFSVSSPLGMRQVLREIRIDSNPGFRFHILTHPKVLNFFAGLQKLSEAA